MPNRYYGCETARAGNPFEPRPESSLSLLSQSSSLFLATVCVAAELLWEVLSARATCSDRVDLVVWEPCLSR